MVTNKGKKSKVDEAFDKIIEMTKDGHEVIGKFDDARVVYTFNSKGELILEEKAIKTKNTFFVLKANFKSCQGFAGSSTDKKDEKEKKKQESEHSSEDSEDSS